jgi:N-acetylmuramoyl-L-alanine amidase
MNRSFYIKLIIFFLLSALITFILIIAFGTPLFRGGTDTILTLSDVTVPKYTTVIIDAGHGGEDGGASSSAGLIEKDVNLEIATILCDMLRANDINVIMTREDDRLLYDRSVNYQGRKKKLDLAARLAVANSTPDAIFISIHMNSFTDSRYSGLQVWYSPNNTDSEPLAELIRSKNHELLQPQNSRTTKSATSAINLLHNASCPAVLVECGFLSNPDEAALFENDEYRQRVAFMLFCSIIEFLNTGNE